MIIPSRLVSNPVAAENPPDRSTIDHRLRMTAAAQHAKKVLPPAVAELVSRELFAANQFGYLASPGYALSVRVADEVLAIPVVKTDTT